MSTIFNGLSAFPITPADAEGRIDEAALRALLARLVAANVQSIGLLGSTGSYPFFTRAERRRAIEIAVAEVAGRVPILVGIGALRTSDVVLLAQDAEAAGADAGLLAPVSYTPLTNREVLAHFETVAGASDLPLCIYNNPGTTHFTFSDDLLVRLSHVRNVVAVKNPAPAAEAAPAHLGALRHRVAAGFSLGYSTDWNAAGAMMAGGDAWYSVAGGLFPRPCLAILAAIHAGNLDEARKLNARLQPLWDLFLEFTSFRVIYAAANILGIVQAAPPRPILPLDEAGHAKVAAVLRDLDLHESLTA